MQLSYDFSFILLALAALTGVIAGLDQWLFRARRGGRADPVVVEYARSFFPIILIVLAVRSFLFEPFRIPSDSMMPTLLDGDFIFVSKFSYGIRLPVINTKVIATGEPERGDVIVFRKPSEPSVNYIKRLVGLPGDRITVRGDAIWVNGQEMKAHDSGAYTEDSCYRNFREASETLGTTEHRVMYCPDDVHRAVCSAKRTLSTCMATESPRALSLAAPPRMYQSAGGLDSPVGEWTVPAGQYFFMGDNRDNSADSRYDLGTVPEGNLVGKAVRIWASFDWPMPRWGRIGKAVH